MFDDGGEVGGGAGGGDISRGAAVDDPPTTRQVFEVYAMGSGGELQQAHIGAAGEEDPAAQVGLLGGGFEGEAADDHAEGDPAAGFAADGVAGGLAGDEEARGLE